MQVKRICRKAFSRDPLSGKGGTVCGGRWHAGGIPVVYGSSSLALAALEFLVHTDIETGPDDLVAITIEIPDKLPLAELTTFDLPKNWREYPAPVELQRMGTEWLEGMKGPVLKVPSVVIPVEPNFLINPNHPDSKAIAVTSTDRFSFDPRLVKRPTSKGRKK